MPRGGKGTRRGGRRGGEGGAFTEQGDASPTVAAAAPSNGSVAVDAAGDDSPLVEAAVTHAPSEPTAVSTDSLTARGAIRARGKWTRSQWQSNGGPDVTTPKKADTPEAVGVASPGAAAAVGGADGDTPAPPELDDGIHHRNHINDEVVAALPPLPSRATVDSSTWPSSTGIALLNRHRLCIAVDALEAEEAERREEVVDEELDDLERVVTHGLINVEEDAGRREMVDEGGACVDVAAGGVPTTEIATASSTATVAAAAVVEQPNDDLAVVADPDDVAVAAFKEFTAAAPCGKEEAVTPARSSGGGGNKKNGGGVAPQSAAKQFESICPCCVM